LTYTSFSEDEVHWRKSARSMPANDCVEVAPLPNCGVGIRDSKSVQAELHISPAAWRGLLQSLKQGAHDL
jgi:hypothetical protein